MSAQIVRARHSGVATEHKLVGRSAIARPKADFRLLELWRWQSINNWRRDYAIASCDHVWSVCDGGGERSVRDRFSTNIDVSVRMPRVARPPAAKPPMQAIFIRLVADSTEIRSHCSTRQHIERHMRLLSIYVLVWSRASKRLWRSSAGQRLLGVNLEHERIETAKFGLNLDAIDDKFRSKRINEQ